MSGASRNAEKVQASPEKPEVKPEIKPEIKPETATEPSKASGP